MQLPQLKSRRPRRSGRDRRRGPRDPSVLPTREAAERRDARRGGGPQDSAFYSCSCGYAFTAVVSTTVTCPHCGTEQAW